jgi:hypothetical protein
MANTKTHEKFPGGTLCISIVFSVLIYAIGAYIASQLNIFALVLYIGYCFWMEFRLIKESCVDCYYYGKVCAFGKGLLCKLFFKKGDTAKFAKREMHWADMLPDLLVILLPIVAGIRVLVRQFDAVVLILMIVLLLLGFVGNAVIRGQYACKYCKQREIGCPAEKLFSKRHKKSSTECGAKKGAQ